MRTLRSGAARSNPTDAGSGFPSLFVEAWAPELGSPFGLEGEPPEEARVEVDLAVEQRHWVAVARPETTPAVESVAVVDGVRRVDARVTLMVSPDAPPTAALLGVWAAGAASWWPRERRSRISAIVAGRRLVVGQGQDPEVLAEVAAALGAEVESVPSADPAALLQRLQHHMREAEGQLAESLAGEHQLVLADGPLRRFSDAPIVGFVKSQRTHYLPGEAALLLGRLAAGERTPLFAFAGPRYPRYSWYLRLAQVPGGHAWSGIARLECSGSLPLDRVVSLADSCSVLLPRLAPPLHVDPRAPQNLVPIGALERHLKHQLGDPALAWRRAREVAWAA